MNWLADWITKKIHFTTQFLKVVVAEVRPCWSCVLLSLRHWLPPQSELRTLPQIIQRMGEMQKKKELVVRSFLAGLAVNEQLVLLKDVWTCWQLTTSLSSSYPNDEPTDMLGVTVFRRVDDIVLSRFDWWLHSVFAAQIFLLNSGAHIRCDRSNCDQSAQKRNEGSWHGEPWGGRDSSNPGTTSQED